MINQNSQFFATLTNVGAAKQANADALGVPWKITQMAIGDANGADPVPDVKQTKLINEVRRAPLNQLKIDPANASVIIAEQVIPADVGGFWIREIGLYDADGDFVAVANCAPSFKPLLVQGSGRTQIVRLNIIVSNAGSVELKIDSSVVLATRAYVDAAILNVLPKNKTAGQFSRVKVNDQGIVVEGDNPETLAAHNIKDAYTKAEILAMIAQASALPVGSMLLFPTDAVAPGFLEVDNSLIQNSVYPDLAAFLNKKYNQPADPAGWSRLPESRGEHLRFWDHGRGVDPGRELGSWQKGSLQAMDINVPGVQGACSNLVDEAASRVRMGYDSGDQALYAGVTIAGVNAGVNTALPGNTEVRMGITRPRNVAFMLCIKAWNAPINQGNIDIAALAIALQSLTRMSSGIQVFSTVGTFDFVVPADARINSVFEIEVWGAGGGGGGAPGDGPSGGGGGGGGYSYARLTGLAPGAIIKVTVGPGGTGGAYRAYGQPGGTSSFGDYLSATGGRGGASVAAQTGGVLGGVGVGGLLNFAGDCGGSSEVTVGGNGGMSPRGGGGGLGGYSVAGGAGFAPGGGGGGCDAGTAAVLGGLGAAGMVVIKWV